MLIKNFILATSLMVLTLGLGSCKSDDSGWPGPDPGPSSSNFNSSVSVTGSGNIGIFMSVAVPTGCTLSSDFDFTLRSTDQTLTYTLYKDSNTSGDFEKAQIKSGDSYALTLSSLHCDNNSPYDSHLGHNKGGQDITSPYTPTASNYLEVYFTPQQQTAHFSNSDANTKGLANQAVEKNNRYGMGQFAQ